MSSIFSLQPQNGRSGTKRYLRIFLFATGFFLFIGASLLTLDGAYASSSPQTTSTPNVSPSVTPTFNMARLEKPVVPEARSQSEEGALIFWGVCLACHGDRGQGLTDEWRFGAFGEDNNCWGSGCHGKDHPPQGFEIPKTLTIPPLAPAGSLGRFSNAQQLYDYLVVMMPWWKPNSLTPEQGWQVTAYLLKMRGNLPDGLILNKTNASAVPLHRLMPPPRDDHPAIFIFAGVLALTMAGWLARNAITDSSSASGADNMPSRVTRPNFIAHLHPPTVPAQQARWRYTLGAGGIAVFLSLILIITGLLEMVYYIPTPEKAAISVETITTFVPFGALIRNLHYWSAQLLVIVALIHLARIIFTGAYSAPRRFNFLLGLGLLAIILLLDFTGYILRWDEGIRWALTAGTNLIKSIPFIGGPLYRFVVGGSEPGPASLIRFYAWHVFILSLTGGFFIVWHLFRVRRDGGISAPPPTERASRNRITRFALLRREILAMFIVGISLIIFSTLIPAPIATPIRGSAISEAETGAPWFFLWVQQLLKLGDPFVLGVLVPLAILILMGLIPYTLDRIPQHELGRWFPHSGRKAQALFVIVAVIIMALTALSFTTKK